MKIKRIAFGFLILALMSCNYVTQMFTPPTPTSTQTSLPTSTLTPPPSLTPAALKPAYIPPQCESTSLATISPDVPIQPTPQFELKKISKETQLQILDRVEQIVEQVYVYPDYNGVDWKGLVADYRSQVEAGLDTTAFYKDMQTMISDLGDDHSAFINPVQVQRATAELQGNVEFVGVGIYSDVDVKNQKLVVISTYPGSPAEYGGIQSHDSILDVDGVPINLNEGIRTRGPECTAVRLTIQSPDESPRDVMLVRSEVGGGLPIDARLVSTTDGSRIGYIFIPSFFDETIPPQIKNALKDFGQLDGLILDVRLNGGGSSSVTYPVLEYFTNGKLGDFVSRSDKEPLIINANPINNSQTVPLVVLVGEQTVSFGEIFAGILRDARGAKIVGETSLGNVEILHPYDFNDGSMLWIAASRFDSAFSDVNWEETGIVPDVQAYAPWDTFYFDTDPSVAAAVKVLGHQ